mmetsp:Transcript_47590/g.77344  ORF Transcript_47590/g.77344 Transcript_47590/m.77344 type:complete len:89 (-) Transcript_47590:1537-1803(-)
MQTNGLVSCLSVFRLRTAEKEEGLQKTAAAIGTDFLIPQQFHRQTLQLPLLLLAPLAMANHEADMQNDVVSASSQMMNHIRSACLERQ